VSRLEGTRLVLRQIVKDDLEAEYDWLRYCNPFLVPGEDGFIVQGVWDRWPEVAPGRRQMEVLFEANPPLPGDRLLNLGAGLGGLERMCVAFCPAIESIVGLEANPTHLAAAKAANPDPSKVAYFAADVRALDDAVDAELAAAVAEGFDKIYMVELLQDLPVEQLDGLVDRCFALLRDGGTVDLVTLTVDVPPRGWKERLITDMVVRRAAPNLADIRRSFARFDCEIAEKNITAVSSQPFIQRVLDDPSIARAMLPWPLSAAFLKIMEAGLGVAERGVYSVSQITVTKAEAAAGRFARGADDGAAAHEVPTNL